MRWFRTFLALLIALALPLQALADARMSAGCCPMAASAQGDAAHEDHVSGADCCHGHDADPSGKTCDEGSGCHCAAHLALPYPALLSVAHAPAPYPAVFPALPYSTTPAAHWRPPAPLSAPT